MEEKKKNKLAKNPTAERNGLRKRSAVQAALEPVNKLIEQELSFLDAVEAPEEPYFKFGNPIYLQELDWAVTVSKYEFPWHDIASEMNFSPKECYEKYTSMIRDPHAFLTKVLSAGGQPREKYQKLMQNQLDQAPRFQTESVDEVFCICRGANLSGFFVACEAEQDCPHGGWLHPECTEDLKNLEREVIDNMGVWYCVSCVERMKDEEKQSEAESEDLRRLEAEVAQNQREICAMEQDIQNEQT